MSATRFNGAGHDVRLEVMGEHGSIAAGLDGTTPIMSAEPEVLLPTGPAQPAFTHRFSGAYVAEIEAWVTALADGGESPVPLREGFEALRVAVACTLSLEENRTVAMSEIPGL